MYKKVLYVVLFVAFVDAATWIGKLPRKPAELAHKHGCYVEEVNDVIPFGSSVTPVGFCYRAECNRRMINYSSCGTVGTDDPKCVVTDEDLSRPYPECCPTVKCEIDNNLL